MSVQTKLKRQEMALKAQQHDEEMAVEREKSKRSAKAQVAGAIASGVAKGATSALLGGSGAAGRLAGAAVSKAGQFGIKRYSFGNHPVWYKKWIEDQLFANVPTWMSRTATRKLMVPGSFDITQGDYNINDRPVEEVTDNNYLPSVIAHCFIPTLAYRTNANRAQDEHLVSTYTKYPINESMKLLLTNIGKVNSRAINPDNSIPGLYILNGTEFVSLMGEIKFLINVIELFQDNDNSVPKLLIEAKGWDYSFILDHIAELRKLYGEFQTRFNTVYPIPADISLIERRYWLNTLLLREGNTPKPVFQLFRQVHFCCYKANAEGMDAEYWYREGSFVAGTDLRTRCKNQNSFTPLFRYLNSMIDNILNDEDMCTFIANLRAVYSGKFYQIGNYDDNKISLTFIDDDVRQQIMNINTLPQEAFEYLTRDNNYLTTIKLSEVHFDADGNLLSAADTETTSLALGGFITNQAIEKLRNRIIHVNAQASLNFNSFKATLSNDDILTMTRLKTIYVSNLTSHKPEGSSDVYYGEDYTFVLRNTEVVLGSKIYAGCKTSSVPVIFNVTTTGSTGINSDDEYAPASVYLETISAASAIDGMYPLFLLYGDGESEITACPIHQWDNCFSISLNNLRSIGYYCCRSLYYTDPTAFSKFSR